VYGIANLILIVVFIPIIILAVSSQSVILIAAAIIILLILLAILGLINSSLNGIYTAAVYQYASTGKSSVFFDDQMVVNAFSQK
jgi:hypothetical protein